MERPDLTKIAIASALFLFLVFALWQIYVFYGRRAEARARYEEVAGELETAQKENERLRAEVEYYKDPENLEKEARARFNYRDPDEKTLIFVTPATTTSQQ